MPDTRDLSHISVELPVRACAGLRCLCCASPFYVGFLLVYCLYARLRAAYTPYYHTPHTLRLLILCRFPPSVPVTRVPHHTLLRAHTRYLHCAFHTVPHFALAAGYLPSPPCCNVRLLPFSCGYAAYRPYHLVALYWFTYRFTARRTILLHAFYAFTCRHLCRFSLFTFSLRQAGARYRRWRVVAFAVRSIYGGTVCHSTSLFVLYHTTALPTTLPFYGRFVDAGILWAW